jgi:(2R)-sulfolactate sulfo-lyase subunit alpha
MSAETRVEVVVHHEGDDVAMAVVSGLGRDRLLRCWLMDRDEVFTIHANQAIPLGHKVALRDIVAGWPVMKYGTSIGVAAVDIHAGDHIHVHNLRSTRW